MERSKVFLVMTILQWLPTIYTRIIHLDPITGSDRITCGNRTSPCKTLDATWSRFLWSTNTSGHVTFFLKPGDYYVDANIHHVLSYTCAEGLVTSLSILMDNSNSFNEDYARIYHSFELTSCQVSYERIQFHTSSIKTTNSSVSFTRCLVQNTDSEFTFLTSSIFFSRTIFRNLTSTSQLLALRSQIVSLVNCTFAFMRLNTEKKYFVDIDSAKSVYLEHVKFENNSGLEFSSTQQKMRLLSLQKIELLHMNHVTLKKNKNLVFHFVAIAKTSGRRWMILDNVNTTVVLKDSNTTVTNISLHKNLRSVAEWNFVLVFDGGSVVLEDLTMHCEHLKHREQLGSPVAARADTHVQCINCTTKYCKRLCRAGYQNVEEILCEECPVGTSAHDWEKTCKKCRQGYYSPTNGTSDCIPCGAGTHCNHLGCNKCTKCYNELFTSPSGASSCTQMSLFFEILLGFIICLVMVPIAVFIIRKKSTTPESDINSSPSADCNVNKPRTAEKVKNKEKYKELKNETNVN